MNKKKVLLFSLIPILIIINIIVYIIFNHIKNNNTNRYIGHIGIINAAIDTDGDQINNFDEFHVYKTNIIKKDSDDDGLDDNVEVELKTNPINSDTDGDGLLDGKRQYLNNVIIAPIDPNPLEYDGLNNIWHHHIKMELNKNIPTYLTDYYEYNNTNNNLRKEKNITDNYAVYLTSNALLFRLDNGGKILHSQTKYEVYKSINVEAKENLSAEEYKDFQLELKKQGITNSLETWQKQFGYNELYDKVFKSATNFNIREAQIYFQDKNRQEYVIWLWRGDYLTMGAGAEMAIYKRHYYGNQIHWNAVDFELPMTLHLYNYSDNKVDTIFNWKPNNNQWWITGFNPDYSDIDVKKQVMIGTINFKDYPDMYQSLKERTQKDYLIKDYIIFDDDNYTVWIYWYEN